MKATDILVEYLKLINNPEISFKEIKESAFFLEKVRTLARILANKWEVERELSFRVSGTTFLLNGLMEKDDWIILLPHYNKEVLDYYIEYPPVEKTEELNEIVVI